MQVPSLFALLAAFALVKAAPQQASSPPAAPLPTGPVHLDPGARLSTPQWTKVEALDKEAKNGWGGWGSSSWRFEFKGDYKKERFSVKTYKQKDDQVWDDTKEADLEVDKKLECTIDAPDGIKEDTTPGFEIKFAEPFISPASKDGVKASCKVVT